MTVRIQKPAFNIREKLSELERPIGLKGSELMRAETAQEARDFVSAGRKNLVINGDMRINQRGLQGAGGTTNLSVGVTYLLDRWYWGQSAGSTFRAATTDDVPSGSPFKNSLRLTLMSIGSLPTTSYHFLRQKIEGFNTEQLCWGTSQAKSVTLSFWVKSSIAAGTHCVYVGFQGVGVYPVLYSINSANTWEYKTITIPGATSGTWGTGTSSSVEVEFDFGVGSTYSATNNTWTYGGNYFSGTGDVNFAAGPANSTWYVTGVQLEVGKNATEFEHRSYGEELALCQRYFCKSYSPETSPGTATNNGLQCLRNYDPSASRGDHPTHVQFPVTMRTIPTVTLYSQNGNVDRYTLGDITLSSYQDQNATISDIILEGTGSIGGVTLSTAVSASSFAYFHYTASAEL